jgi:hypothetical protein
VQAKLLAAEHEREHGAHAVKIESRNDHHRREMAARRQHPPSA